jgi:hypothetical protein
MKQKDYIDTLISGVKWKVGKFDMLPVFLGTMMAFLDVVMMTSTKLVSKGQIGSWWGMPLAVAAYAFEPIIFRKSLDYEGMVVMNLMWDLTSDVIITILGFVVFNEKVNRYKFLGVCLSMVSVMLMAYTDSE